MGMHEKTCANPLKEQRFFPSRQHCLAEVFRYLLTYLTYWSAGRANWPMRCSLEVICVHMFAPERRPCALTDANGSVCVRKCAHLSFRRALTDANAPSRFATGGGTHYIYKRTICYPERTTRRCGGRNTGRIRRVRPRCEPSTTPVSRPSSVRPAAAERGRHASRTPRSPDGRSNRTPTARPATP